MSGKHSWFIENFTIESRNPFCNSFAVKLTGFKFPFSINLMMRFSSDLRGNLGLYFTQNLFIFEIVRALTEASHTLTFKTVRPSVHRDYILR